MPFDADSGQYVHIISMFLLFFQSISLNGNATRVASNTAFKLRLQVQIPNLLLLI